MQSHEARPDHALPIHFFTIVLNGEPFIRYHENVFRRLSMPWHWHVVEGVASLRHDTAWSLASGGHVPDSFHDHGRSNDGTSAYLEDLAGRFPDNVTIYRKPLGTFWDGKREMVNAPLPNIAEPCLLWQVDSDELWTTEQIYTVHKLFMNNPTRTAAYYWCWFYVGPGKVISTRYNYAANPIYDWLRTWRFQPGATWAAHEPPILAASESSKDTDIAKIHPFDQDETEAAGAVFHHFAYVTEDQVAFKEKYYGYEDAVPRWRALQTHQGSGALKDYFGWVSDNTMFDDTVHNMIDPIARFDPHSESWIFDGAGTLPKGSRATAVRRPRIVIDGIFWQYLASGIGRVWENVLREWVVSGFTDNVVLLDRAGTTPRIPGVHYRTISKHEYARTGRDSLYLETTCRQLDADLFVSTYYSTPTTTPSFFTGYDMIPEVLGFPLEDEAWKEKRRAITHASAHGMISRNSARDLERIYPAISAESTYVMYCGVAPIFRPPGSAAVDTFRKQYRLDGNEYVLMVGERLGFGGYKNGVLAFRALARLPKDRSFVLVCVGGQAEIEPCLRELAPGLDVRRLTLDDAALVAAYAGAHALLYPSKYEGFGMPPVECMACGTPAIVCRNSSLPEVVGDAALYVDADDPVEMAEAIVRLYDPELRAGLTARGVRQAEKFTFATMAEQLSKALEETHERLRTGRVPRPTALWTEMRGFQQGCQTIGIGIDVTTETAGNAGYPAASEPMVRLTAGPELAEALRTIETMRDSAFWKARELTFRLVRSTGLRRYHFSSRWLKSLYTRRL